MSEESKIMSTTEETKVILYPKHSLGSSILKGVAGFTLGFVPRLFAFKAIDSWNKSGFFKSLKEGTQVDQGDIKDIIEKQIKLTELTLTNQNFFFLYEKGFMSKQQKLIVFPLEHANAVSSHKNKSVTLGYDVPREGKDKPQHFDLNINVQNADAWASAIKKLI
jgi:hypothetical protein